MPISWDARNRDRPCQRPGFYHIFKHPNLTPAYKPHDIISFLQEDGMKKGFPEGIDDKAPREIYTPLELFYWSGN
jgi:hypothetical protein